MYCMGCWWGKIIFEEVSNRLLLCKQLEKIYCNAQPSPKRPVYARAKASGFCSPSLTAPTVFCPSLCFAKLSFG